MNRLELARASYARLAPRPGQDLEQADAALVGCAGALATWTGRPEVRAELGRLEPPGGRAGQSASWESDRSVAEWAAGRPWRDLVAVEDYFHPCRGLNLAQPGGPVREDLDAFDPLVQPDLGEPGDHVSRLLLARLGFWMGPLQRLWGLCLCGCSGWAGESVPELESLGASWAVLEEATSSLEVAWLCLATRPS